MSEGQRPLGLRQSCLPDQQEDKQRDFFHAVLDRSLTAEAKATTVDRFIEVAGFVLNLKFAGDALAQSFGPALAHLEVCASASPDAVFHVWDSESTGTEMLPSPFTHGCFTNRGDIWTMGSNLYRSAYSWTEYALSLFDAITATGVYWAHAATALPSWAVAAPLRCLFHFWGEARGCQLMHAAAVGNQELGAALIAGAGGLGKSTTALACIGQGLDYLGDDYVLVQIDPVPRVHTLYCSAKLNWDQLARFPRLADLARGEARASDKAAIYLYPELSERLVKSLALRTIVTPSISHRPRTAFAPISGLAMERSTAPTTMSQLPHARRDTYQFINRLIARLPAFELKLGTDLDGVAEAIARQLATLPSPAHDLDHAPAGHPLFSVVVPVHDGAALLLDAVSSVLAQNYPAIELIVVDYGSSGEAETVTAELPLPVLLLKHHHGRIAAINRGIREASGELITILDLESLWPAGNLQAMLKILLEDESCDVVQGFGQIREAVAEKSGDGISSALSLEPSPDYLTAAIYRRQAFQVAGLFDQEMGIGEDGEWFARARRLGLTVRQVSDVALMRRRLADAPGDKFLHQLNGLRTFKNALDQKRARDRLQSENGEDRTGEHEGEAWAKLEGEFRNRLNARFKRWYHPDRGPRLAFLASLVNKTAMYPYVTGKGLDLPRRYADVASLEEIDFAALPARLVTKPSNASVGAGVMLFADEIELFSGDRVPIASRAAYAGEKLALVLDKCTNGETRIIVEELVQDFDPAYTIPRDFKVYVAGGKARLIQLINRNGAKQDWSGSFYSRDWEFIDRQLQTGYRMGLPMKRPERLEDLLAAADLIAADLQCFYRLDFYMADRGPVFGEFTSYPFGGRGFTPLGERLMCDLMDRYPDEE